ncbi:hypothetical protein PINS_up009836 [Pythium insidiosum]|nr:hypothetical protein PINS_up009836 [Pythium insidiosum]
MFLADWLRQLDPARVPMLLTRGYGDDEWRMFVSRFPSFPVVVGADRLRLGKEAALRHGDALSCVLLEDGLQQWRLAKDLEIVMVDALAPFGNGKLIPHGSLREVPGDALARADIVVIHNANAIDRAALTSLTQNIRRLTDPARDAVVATSEMRITGLCDMDNTATAALHPQAYRHTTAVVFCGVGNPASVVSAVRAMGDWRAVHLEPFPDHHAFSREDLHDVLDLAAALRARHRDHDGDEHDVLVITTEKDVARCSDVMRVVMKERGATLRILQATFALTSGVEDVRNRVRTVLT